MTNDTKTSKKLSYGIVGDGRVAKHISRYFSLLGIPFRHWSRRSFSTTGQTPLQALASCDVVLILISDSAIEGFIQQWHELKQKKLVHFSGSLVTPLAQGAHPLMTFGQELYSEDQYRAIPFVTDEGATPFQELFPELPNSHFAIPKELKPLYHSLCVMSGNFTTLLWQKFFHELESKFDIPRKAAHPYLKTIVENLLKDPDRALTGPFQRKDLATVQRNLEALAGDQYQSIYRAFAETHLNSSQPGAPQ